MTFTNKQKTVSSKTKGKFLQFVGNCALNYKNVCAYKMPNGQIRLVAEHAVSGKPLSNSSGIFETYISAAEFDDEWAHYNGAVTVKRALKFVGFESNSSDENE